MNHDKIKTAFDALILSASGWRKVFACDGDEESFTPAISEEDRLLTACMAHVFSDLVLADCENPTIALGTDSRPTGRIMAAAMVPVFLERGVKVRYTGICAAPEIMAWAGTEESLNGFCYISASHNPVGHNGVKFGLGGGVIGGDTASSLIVTYRAAVENGELLRELEALLNRGLSTRGEEIFEEMRLNKNASFLSYGEFTRRVASDRSLPEDQESYFSDIKERIAARPLGVVAELNGSARSLSIDEEYLTDLGVKVTVLNGEPGQIVHPIVPEGANLDLCRRELEKAHAADPAYLLGYVPDCDGDRGNLVYFNGKTGRAEILEAQEVFALSVLSELTGLKRSGADMSRTAVAVNGPTSLRIDALAASLGSRVFRAEVGEANVVYLAASLREQGYTVRLLGEGSNGGNITHPAQVRDPLNTLTALMNLLLVHYPESALEDIIAGLPEFTTTSAFEPQAKARITTGDHGLLKAAYEEIFPGEWESRKEELKERWGVVSWEEANTEGTEERWGVGPQYRSGAEKGGFKILFKNAAGQATDYIWMRGSGTEPVFRVMADCRGADAEREAWFLNWHKSLIDRADALVRERA